MKAIRILMISCALMTILAMLSPASALKISGSIWKQDINPGESAEKEINISIGSKDSANNYTIEVTGLEQTLQGINRPTSDENDTSPYTIRPFITATPTNFYLEPSSSQTIIAKAEIPADVGAGGRYAIISLRSAANAPSADENGASKVGVSVGSDIPVVFTVAESSLQETGEITDLNIEEPISDDQQNISIILRNTGNIHYKAKAKAELRDDADKVLAQAEGEFGISSIVPPFSRLFELSLVPEASLEPGSYKIIASAELEDGTVLDSQEIGFKI